MRANVSSSRRDNKSIAAQGMKARGPLLASALLLVASLLLPTPLPA